MNEFTGKLAVITGGGEGTGREIAIQLANAGCDLAICDVSIQKLNQTKRHCEAAANKSVKITTHICNVVDEVQVLAFVNSVQEEHETHAINFLFNHSSVGGGRSFIKDSQDDWERCFKVCWYGVYYCIRAFQPLLMASDKGHIINSSSVNNWWERAGGMYHSAYETAKFAIKGFSESLAVELRCDAPHIEISLVVADYFTASLDENELNIPNDSSDKDSACMILEGVSNKRWLV